jgi:DNA invertase Pin-like site-specific DNA recombinase
MRQRGLGWAIGAAPYIDRAISGQKLTRPELQRMLSELKALRVTHVVVFELDRAFRNLRDQLNVHHDLTQRRVTLVSVIDSIDTSTDEGMMHFQLKGMVSEFQAKQTGRKIRSVLKYKAGQGERLGPPPFGYSRADKGIIPNDDAPIVVIIFERYAAGAAALGDLSADLNAEGYTFRDWTGRRGPFLPERIRQILANRTYLGENNGIPDCHEAIVSSDLWQRANAVRLKRGAVRGRVTVRSTTTEGVLSGIVRCARCGLCAVARRMTIITTTARTGAT